MDPAESWQFVLPGRLEAAAQPNYLTASKIHGDDTRMQGLTRFLGDTPTRVLLKLVVVSFLVGLVMSAFGWTPFDILYGIRDFFARIWTMGFATLDRFLGYMLLGAAIVVPIFLVVRLLRYRS